MSKILKKVLQRASWIPGDTYTHQHPLSTPEAPPVLAAIAGNSRHRRSHSQFEVERPEEEEEDTGNPTTIAIIGAGQRGKVGAHGQTFGETTS
jgi:hypothetical protein